MAVDSGKLAIYTAQRRLLITDQESAFEVCHAGLYDNALLEVLPFAEFQAFTLDLFGCRAGTFAIAGVPMAGRRRGDPVHVFPFHLTEAALDLGYVESLHERVKDKVDQAFYIIVPDSRCDPSVFEDVIAHGSTTYFLLRVPYSVIEALYGRDFKQLSQPAALAEVNDALDSYGFEFMELPEAQLRVTAGDSATTVEVQSFYRGGLDPELAATREDMGRRDLAMILVDAAFDGVEFCLTEHLFGDDLRSADWSFQVAHSEGATVMLVLVDVFGNELRLVQPTASVLVGAEPDGRRQEGQA